MKHADLDNTFARWARAGVLYSGAAARRSPDLERLLLDTARCGPEDSRLVQHAVGWLTEYGNLIARHRLKRLAIECLDDEQRPVLGFLLDEAVRLGAPRELNVAGRACGRLAELRPLFRVYTTSPVHAKIARSSSSPGAEARGFWAPAFDRKTDALRPIGWILQKNPGYQERAVRKGDLRTTILETLRRDVPGHLLRSEGELARLCAANRPAVTASLNDLRLEGFDLRHPDPEDRRRTQIRLVAA